MQKDKKMTTCSRIEPQHFFSASKNKKKKKEMCFLAELRFDRRSI